MKTYFILFSIWFISICFKPSDYRDTDVGTYVGKRVHKHLNEQRTALVFDTANYSITVSKNLTDSLIDIATKEGKYTAKLLSGAIFRSDTKRFFGNFSNDSIYLENIPSMAPLCFRYIGKK